MRGVGYVLLFRGRKKAGCGRGSRGTAAGPGGADNAVERALPGRAMDVAVEVFGDELRGSLLKASTLGQLPPLMKCSPWSIKSDRPDN